MTLLAPIADRSIRIPEGRSLYPFQAEGITEMLRFLGGANSQHGVYNAYTPGLGKTVMTTACINTISPQRVLIVVSAVGLYVWETELKSWLTRAGCKILVASAGTDLKASKNADIVITTYGLIARADYRSFLESQKWDLFIADEAHYAKSMEALRTKATFRLAHCAGYRIALSGTPFLNNIVDGFTWFNFFEPTVFSDYFKFTERYSHQHPTPWGVKYYGVKEAAELRTLIRQHFYIRRTKEEVFADLPPKVYQRIELGKEYAYIPPKSDQEKLDTEVKVLLGNLERGEPVPEAGVTLAAERRLQGEKQLPAVLAFIRELVDQELPILVFGWHRNVIARIVSEFAAYNPVVVTGDVSAKERAEAVRKFQAGETNLFVGQFKAAGEAISLPRAEIVVAAELPNNPATMDQAVCRAHRITTKHCVTVYYFVAKGSVTEGLAEMIVDKARTIAEVAENE